MFEASSSRVIVWIYHCNYIPLLCAFLIDDDRFSTNTYMPTASTKSPVVIYH